MRRSNASDVRKKDMREKIELGLIEGLRYDKRALLLGLLVDAANVTERERLRAIGARHSVHEGK